ncbi:hypothetical protein LINPERHAP2_LOCUS33312 [Linum perenne]
MMREGGERVSLSRVGRGGDRRLVSGGFSVLDQDSGDVQIKDSWISFSDSSGRFGSDFKLVVSKNSASHFIFLEAAQVQWLEGVLKVARDGKWFFPRGCLLDSSRRRIVVARFKVKGEPILRISECCAKEKVFFVDIPSDAPTGAWSSFLNLVQKLGGGRGQPKVVTDARSFAEAVGSRGLPEKGRCALTMVDDEPKISVSEEGLKERLGFLEKCLVIRFVGEEEVVWPVFRSWIQRFWGIPLESLIYPMGDALWLLVCSSAQEVNRIIALKRTKFGKLGLRLDAWIKAAGRSSVLLDSGVAWVTIRGIPLHLRSNELMKSLGEACGGFLASSRSNDLSSFRIKVKLQGKLPKTIPVHSGSEVFPVCVEVEAESPVPAYVQSGCNSKVWKKKDKGVMVSPRTRLEEWRRFDDGERPLSEFVVGEASGEKSLTELVSSLGLTLTAGTEESCLQGSEDLIGRGNRDRVMGIDLCESVRVMRPRVAAEENAFCGLRLTSLGLLVGKTLFSLEDSVFFKPARPPVPSSDWFLTLGLGSLGPISFCSVEGPTLVSGLRNGLRTALLTPSDKISSVLSEVCSGCSNAILDSSISEGWVDVPVRFPTSAELVNLGWSTPRASVTAAFLVSQEDVLSDSGYQVGDGAGSTIYEDEELLSVAVQKVSSVIGLEADGSPDLGTETAISLCKEVLRRRSAPTSRSRTTRESVGGLALL